jgi:hypothetical protein
VGGFWTAGVCKAACQAQAKNGVITSTLVIAIILFIAAPALLGNSLARF